MILREIRGDEGKSLRPMPRFDALFSSFAACLSSRNGPVRRVIRDGREGLDANRVCFEGLSWSETLEGCEEAPFSRRALREGVESATAAAFDFFEED